MNKNSNKTSSFSKKRKFKHGSYAVILTAVFVVVVILLNIGATVLASKVNLTVDLTANKDFSVSEENKEYIKKVERNVNIVVCCDRETYIDSYYGNLLGSNYADSKYLNTSGSSTDLINYFNQNTKLLDEYTKLNSKITVEYADPQDPEFSKYTNKYPNASLRTGDIIVESEFELDGETVKRHKILDTDDIFTIDSVTYASYGISLITANRIETAVTSAIYAVTADSTFKVALITANEGKSIDNLQNLMEMNNYEFTVVDSLLGYSIPKDTDLVIISAPKYDYSGEELKIIDDYLHIDDDDDRALMFIGNADTSNLPNLNEFISEWGYVVTPNHTLLETNDSNAYYSSYNFGYKLTDENGVIDKIGEKNYMFLANLNMPVQAKEISSRYVKTLLEIPASVVARPNDADENWSAEKAELKGPFVGLGLTTLSQYDANNELHTASFIMLNSVDFINSMFNNYAEVGNIDVMMTAIDSVVGREDIGISFDTRTFETASFTAPSNGTALAMRIIFIGVIPLAILACGVIVWMRRRRS